MNTAPTNARWRSLYQPVDGVRPWAPRVAWLIVSLPLPSSLWRVFGVWFGPDHGRGDVPAWLPMEVYVAFLSAGSMLLAFTAVGLVARWGEFWPRRLPILGGRPIPLPFVLVPALAGASVLTAMATIWTPITTVQGVKINGDPVPPDFPLNPDTWEGALACAAYAPLMLWGPLLGALTIAYWKRRRVTLFQDAAGGGRARTPAGTGRPGTSP